MESNAKNAKVTYDLENKILHTLSAASEIMELLADDNLIDILAESKEVSDEIAHHKLGFAQKTHQTKPIRTSSSREVS